MLPHVFEECLTRLKTLLVPEKQHRAIFNVRGSIFLNAKCSAAKSMVREKSGRKMSGHPARVIVLLADQENSWARNSKEKQLSSKLCRT